MIRTTGTCRQFLPADPAEALSGNNFYYVFLFEFVARYGLEHDTLSIHGLRDFARFSSSELAIRRCLETHRKTTLQHMCERTQSDDVQFPHLTSEGVSRACPGQRPYWLY
jgi:hypothetical protein